MADKEIPSNENIKPRVVEYGEEIIESVETPVEIFFLFLFVVGVLTIASTSLVGGCGNIEDDFLGNRVIEPQNGAVFIVKTPITIDGVQVDGVCGVIEKVNGGSADVKIFAKIPPQYASKGGYQPIKSFTKILSAPVEGLFHIHTRPLSSEVPLSFLELVETKSYTNTIRSFYLNGFAWLIGILFILSSGLYFVGRHFKKKRETWYKYHSLRSKYISRLMQNKPKRQELLDKWDNISTENPEDWNKCLVQLQEILDETLLLLNFEGGINNLDNIGIEDIWTIEELWEKYSISVRIIDEKDEELVLTKDMLEDIVKVYKETFIWLGLLPYDA